MSSPRRLERLAKWRPSKLAVVGMVLLALGLAAGGWLGYELVVSNLVSDHSYGQEEKDVRAAWAQASTSGTGQAIGLLRVPTFGAGFEVPILAGTSMHTLSRGVGCYKSSAMPGQLGNFAITGHRITHGQPFARLLTLRRGDEVVVETRQSVFTYVIDVPPKDLTVKADAGWVLDPVPGQPRAKPTEALLTLTTSQDVLPSSDRAVGFAHLASTTNKG